MLTRYALVQLISRNITRVYLLLLIIPGHAAGDTQLAIEDNTCRNISDDADSPVVQISPPRGCAFDVALCGSIEHSRLIRAE